MYLDAPSFVEYWRNARVRTCRVLDQLPEAELDWTYAPGRFTFGDLFRHLAGIERYMYGENVMQRPSTYQGHAVSLAPSIEAVRAYMARCHTEAIAIFVALTPEHLEAKCLTPAGKPITVWKWLRAMVEHEAHHRGQLYLMASMRGISLPPLYGLTEEQVLAASESRRAGIVT